ncbi:MAG: DUF1592 domain-containing protein [Pirellulaceae bacterium]
MWTGFPLAGTDADDIYHDKIQPFLKGHCQRCHNAERAEGDLRLDNLAADFVNRPAADHWIEVLDRIHLGEMPPEGEPKPTAEQLSEVTDWITRQLADVRHRKESSGGRVLLRRLTRLEYANSVRDLLHVEFIKGEGPIDRLPPDGSIRGFDRNSNALLVDPSLMNSYFEVASQIADRAIRFRPPLVPQRTVRFEYRDIVDSAMKYQIDERSAYLDGDTLVVMQGAARSFAKLRHPFNDMEVPVTGRYRVRIQAAADRGESDDPVYMRVQQGADDNIAQFRVDARPGSPEVYSFETVRDALLQGEYQVAIVHGTEFSTYVGSRGQQARDADERLQRGEIEAATTDKARLRAQGEDFAGAMKLDVLDLSKLPKLRLDWIEVTGPLQGDYPPQSMTSFFPQGWSTDKQYIEMVTSAFARFLPRAYRRPVTRSELDEVVQLVQRELYQDVPFETAVKTGIIATLCSPKFLYLYEPGLPNLQTRRLNDFELASRLSYFLWSSKPDDSLLRRAIEKKLSDKKVLLAEVDRLLADDRMAGFLEGFVRQWLKIDEFDRFPPDEAIFPDYYQTHLVGLSDDLLMQPVAMVREILTKDESLLSLLDSDWSMLNERLAAFYGIEDVQGEAMRRVTLPRENDSASIRGGLLGMAGIHRWGSDGSRTKPVDRGKYILDVLFNDPPPPPPPNAGEIEPNIRGEKLTVSERLALHREQATCNNCHRRIDPYGLALENFNVIGQWRTHADGEKPLSRWGDDRPEIVIGGRLPSGEEYDSFESFKRLLVEQDERFLRGLTEKLLMYALARTIEPADRPVIEQAVNDCRENGYTLRSIIKTIVASEPFAQK